jgi:hypothetical protein
MAMETMFEIGSQPTSVVDALAGAGKIFWRGVERAG